MKREEAKDLFREDLDSYGKPKAVMTKIDKIFNDFEIEKSKFQNKITKLKQNLRHLGAIK